MRIPSTTRAVIKDYALDKWVNSRRCDLTAYFLTIDVFLPRLKVHAGPEDEGPPWDAVATLLAATLDHEGALYDYTEEKQLQTSDSEIWGHILLAAAMLIINKHQRRNTKDKSDS
ncbi:MAG: hypothetical protein JWM47_1790 [Acidimicrobiales bacterium]|nr:hypothetical protein [Acidimicrobiales bacterium]